MRKAMKLEASVLLITFICVTEQTKGIRVDLIE